MWLSLGELRNNKSKSDLKTEKKNLKRSLNNVYPVYSYFHYISREHNPGGLHVHIHYIDFLT